MQKAPVLKGSGLAPIDDEPAHVFGKNLEARVVEAHEDDDKEVEKEDIKKPDDEEDVANIKKRKFDTITGEEDEETVFQGEFKLFVWDVSSSNWIEKGRGQLKLNDDLNEKRSRLIMRIGGTFRIILNVAIRHSLFKVISTSKTSIRFSDCQNVWAASGSNAKQLGDLLDERIAAAAKRVRESSPPTKEIKDTESVDTVAKEEGDAAVVKNGDDDTEPSEEVDDEVAKKEGDNTAATEGVTAPTAVASGEAEDTIGRKEPEGQKQDEKQSDDPPHSNDDQAEQNSDEEKPEETSSADNEDKKIPE